MLWELVFQIHKIKYMQTFTYMKAFKVRKSKQLISIQCQYHASYYICKWTKHGKFFQSLPQMKIKAKWDNIKLVLTTSWTNPSICKAILIIQIKQKGEGFASKIGSSSKCLHTILAFANHQLPQNIHVT